MKMKKLVQFRFRQVEATSGTRHAAMVMVDGTLAEETFCQLPCSHMSMVPTNDDMCITCHENVKGRGWPADRPLPEDFE